ncbi:hypothetical protein [Methylorubrum populi]|uniref:Uncharacterized protein n=1 Tax=Methylorubrum populi TaxID=223967 RepID=A0A833J2G1_9HYPH|nr:hypothetical protein [Methylorubrum populi]KAB7782406.1 hypothetical protein F8B43_5161 [Methylorubrum populi]
MSRPLIIDSFAGGLAPSELPGLGGNPLLSEACFIRSLIVGHKSAEGSPQVGCAPWHHDLFGNVSLLFRRHRHRALLVRKVRNTETIRAAVSTTKVQFKNVSAAAEPMPLFAAE